MSPRLILAIAAVSLLAVAGFLWLTRAPTPAERASTPHPSTRKTGAQAPATESAAPPSVIPPEKHPHTPKTEIAPAAPAVTEATVAATGTLHITSDVAGAQVFLDHKFIGEAPITASDVAPGAHRLNVSAPGYEGYASSIDVAAGPRDIAVRFKEVTLDAHIDVVHKHAFGSCKGVLSATPEGLKYDTSNSGDAFTTTLLDLSGFDVNYLEKTLKVKLKAGKSFTFTDPDGNADHLFVFQRDVSKVRERLRKGE